MKLFIIGSTGILGKRVIPMLIQNGHEVKALVRSNENLKKLQEMGAQGVIGDVFDYDTVKEESSGYDGFIHLATSIPHDMTQAEAWEMNGRLRTEATEIALQAVLHNKIKFFVQNNVTLGYGHLHGKIVTEEDKLTLPVPTAISIPKKFRGIYDDTVRSENIIEKYQNKGAKAIILRFGWFYAGDSKSFMEMLEDIKNRKVPTIGGGSGILNFIHVDDAATATVLAIENYKDHLNRPINITDGNPATWKEFMNYVASKMNAKNPANVPVFLGKLFAGRFLTNYVLHSHRIDNSYALTKLKWKPKYPTFQEGIDAILEGVEL